MLRTVESWLTLAAVIIAAVIVVLLVVKSYKYIRAFFKRLGLMHSLKKMCRRRKYKMERLSSCYGSIFRHTDGDDLLITTPTEKYAVKFFTCLRYKDTYTFSDIKHYTTASNAGMTLVNMNPFISGIAKPDPSLKIPHFYKAASGSVEEVEVTGGEESGALHPHRDAKSVLCVNPIPIELRRVKGNTTVQVFDGDELDGYTVYSGSALLSHLDDACADAPDYARAV